MKTSFACKFPKIFSSPVCFLFPLAAKLVDRYSEVSPIRDFSVGFLYGLGLVLMVVYIVANLSKFAKERRVKANL